MEGLDVFSLTKKGLEEFVESPVASGLSVYATGLIAAELGARGIIRQFVPEGSVFPLFAGFTAYTSLGLLRDYYFHRNNIRLPDGPSLKNRIYKWILNNKKICGLLGTVFGVLTYRGWLNMVSPGYIEKHPDLKLEFTAAGLVGGGIAGEFSSVLLRTANRIRLYSKQKAGNIIETTYNHLWEHPLALALGVGALRFIQKYEEYHGSLVKQATNVVTSSLEGLAAGAVDITAGGLLHSNSIKQIWARTKKMYYRLARDTYRELEAQRSLVNISTSLEDRIKNSIGLANLYYKIGKKEEAEREYRNAISFISRKGDRINHFEIFNNIFKFPRFSKPRYDDQYSQSIVGVLHGDHKAVNILKEIAEKSKNPKDMYVYGKALEMIGHKKEANDVKISVLEKLVNEERLEKIAGQTRNVVSLFGSNPFFKTAVIMKHGDAGMQDRFIKEMKYSEAIKKIFSDDELHDAPSSICVKEINGRAYYSMECESGELLYDRLARGANVDKKTWFDIINGLCLIYTKLPRDFWVEERDYAKCAESSLSDAEDLAKRRIVEGLRPVIESFRFVPRVVQKDCQPKNIMLGDLDRIIYLDNELRYTVPLTHEIADLLDYFPVYDFKTNTNFALRFYEEYSKTDPIQTSQEDFVFAYLNSVILRTLDRYKYFVKEPELRPLLTKQIDHSTAAVNYIKSSFKKQYNDKIIRYDCLSIGLSGLRNNLSKLEAS